MSLTRKKLIKKYPYIHAWGIYMGSFQYYVDRQLELAEHDKAPTDSVFKKMEGHDDATGCWVKLDEIQNPIAKEYLARVKESIT